MVLYAYGAAELRGRKQCTPHYEIRLDDVQRQGLMN